MLRIGFYAGLEEFVLNICAMDMNDTSNSTCKSAKTFIKLDKNRWKQTLKLAKKCIISRVIIQEPEGG